MEKLCETKVAMGVWEGDMETGRREWEWETRTNSVQRRIRTCLWQLLAREEREAYVPSSQQSVSSSFLPWQTSNAAERMYQLQSLICFLMLGLNDSLFWAPHTTSAHYNCLLQCNVVIYFISHVFVYIPYILTMEAKQIEHVSIPPLSPVIQFASTGYFFLTLEGCYSMLIHQSSSVSIYPFFSSVTDLAMCRVSIQHALQTQWRALWT